MKDLSTSLMISLTLLYFVFNFFNNLYVYVGMFSLMPDLFETVKLIQGKPKNIVQVSLLVATGQTIFIGCILGFFLRGILPRFI